MKTCLETGSKEIINLQINRLTKTRLVQKGLNRSMDNSFPRSSWWKGGRHLHYFLCQKTLYATNLAVSGWKINQ